MEMHPPHPDIKSGRGTSQFCAPTPRSCAEESVGVFTSQLACSEFQHCSSFDGDGVEYTGDNGFSVNLCTLEQLPWRLRNTTTVPMSDSSRLPSRCLPPALPLFRPSLLCFHCLAPGHRPSLPLERFQRRPGRGHPRHHAARHLHRLRGHRCCGVKGRGLRARTVAAASAWLPHLVSRVGLEGRT